MTIMAFVAALRPEKRDTYLALHAATWPAHMALLHAHGLRDYTIHLDAARLLLFARFTYIGDDFDADMAAIDAQPIAREWDAVTAPCLVPGPDGDPWQPLAPAFAMPS